MPRPGAGLLCALICLLALAGAQPSPLPTFSGLWDVLGPFPRGFRELGADPLECWGGILGVPRGTGYYASEFGTNATIGWSVVAQAGGALGPVGYSIWNSSFLSAAYGWPAEVWQGWAVTDVAVEAADEFVVQCLGTAEFYLDAQYFHGDYYSYGLGAALVALQPGTHSLAVKLENAVEYGGAIDVFVQCSFLSADRELLLLPGPAAALLPDLVEGRLAAPYGAVAVLNAAQATLLVQAYAAAQPPDPPPADYPFTVQLVPGQAANVGFLLDPAAAASGAVQVCVTAVGYVGCLASRAFVLANRSRADPAHAFTFLDYDGSVQYAALRPPPPGAPPSGALLVALHGPGVDAASPAWTGAFGPQPSAPILFPSGRRAYGYDWHGPSALNVLAAVRALQAASPAPGPALALDPNALLFTGHSMGGAGAWFLGTHQPDRALALAPAAGFISLRKYVPYDLQLGRSHLDSFLAAVLDAGLAPLETDQHASNLVGLPLLVRYGAEDEVVSPWNSKRLARLVQELARNQSAVQVSEAPGAGHWFPDIFSAPDVQAFLATHLAAAAPPPFPPAFTLTVLDPGSTGPRGSLLVLQLGFPFRAGKLIVQQLGPVGPAGAAAWSATSQNVARWCMESDPRSANVSALTLDGTLLQPLLRCAASHYCLVSRAWQPCDPSDWTAAGPRRPSQYGPAVRIFERRFAIVHGSDPADPAGTALLQAQALTLANDWFVYGGGNVSVYDQVAVPPAVAASLSLVLLGTPDNNPLAAQLLASSLSQVAYSSNASFTVASYGFSGPGVGLLCLAPWAADGLELALLVSGLDAAGQRAAFEALPFRPGQASADWLVVQRDPFACSGALGVLGAGFWGNAWQFVPSLSYVRPTIPVLVAPPQPDYGLFAVLVVVTAAAALSLATATGIMWAVQHYRNAAAAAAAGSSSLAAELEAEAEDEDQRGTYAAVSRTDLFEAPSPAARDDASIQ